MGLVNELRINNKILIKSNDGKAGELVETSVSAQEIVELSLETCIGFPIRINNDILIKRLGFIVQPDFEIYRDELNDTILISRKYQPSGSYVLILTLSGIKFEFSFLHEFQNLWFTLFKEEIPILKIYTK